MRRVALMASILALAACGDAPPGADATPGIAPESALPGPSANTILPPAADSAVETVAADAGADYREPLRLIGTEPFWGVEIAEAIMLQRPDHPTITTVNAGPTINGDVAVWTTREMSIRLEPANCSDGMSDNRYPYRATVTVAGGVLKGCGARADRWPREGG